MGRNIIPERGERAFICGQTGSGKTGVGIWLLHYMPGTLIYDTKGEPKFTRLPNSVRVTSMDDAIKAFQDRQRNWDYVIFRPPIIQANDPAFMDSCLMIHYDRLKHVGAYLDETFTFHTASGRAGVGLLSLLQRGRSRGITLVMAAQRPAWLSGSCITESQRFYILQLTALADRKKLAETVTGLNPNFNPRKFYFNYFDFNMDEPILFSPVTLDNNITADYIDKNDDSRVWL